MTPTPIDLDALAREVAKRAFGKSRWQRMLSFLQAEAADRVLPVLRDALAQVSPTGELRAKVEALTRYEPSTHPWLVTTLVMAPKPAGEWVRRDAVLALLPATGEPRPAKDAAVYDRLYEAWNALSFDVTTMPPAAKDAAITACREELDAVLKGFEGRSFTSWCDAQWADGSGRVSLPPNRPATGEPAPTCATCRHKEERDVLLNYITTGVPSAESRALIAAAYPKPTGGGQ